VSDKPQLTGGPELFAPDELVIWNKQGINRRVDIENLKHEFGKGPFRVVGIRPAFEEALALHPQFVEVRIREGRGVTAIFTGLCFLHLRH